jgi:hypothetical protein
LGFPVSKLDERRRQLVDGASTWVYEHDAVAAETGNLGLPPEAG